MGMKREPRGTPSGGQFSTVGRSEPDIDLGKQEAPIAPKPRPPVIPAAKEVPQPQPETTVLGGIAAVGRRMHGDAKGVVRFDRRKADEFRNQ